MAEELWRAHSFDKSKDSDGGTTTSGSFTYWEDEPVPKYEIGDEFWPVGPQGPKLKVTKVSVSDNVIGMKDGKPFRQWQITVEGDSADAGDDTKIRYTFDISKDDSGLIYKNGSMEVINDGDEPVFRHNVGDEMTLPGVGKIVCTKVSGADEWTDKGVRRWTMTYEGSSVAADSSTGTKVKYTLDITKDDNGLIYKTGTMEVVNVGDAPAFKKNLHETFTVPGLGSVECVKIGGGNEWNGDVQVWTMTYEGTVIAVDGDAEAKVRYTFDISKDDSGLVIKTGSMSITSKAGAGGVPNFDGYTVGGAKKLNIPGVGLLTCVKISGGDEELDDGTRLWTTTFDGTDFEAIDPTTQITYTFDKTLEGNGLEFLTLTMNARNKGETPSIDKALKSGLTISGIDGEGKCTKQSGSKEFDENGEAYWNTSYEFVFVQLTNGYSESGYANYSFDISQDDNGLIYKTGRMEYFLAVGSNLPNLEVGGHIAVPGVGNVLCTKISGGHETYVDSQRLWTITAEGVAIDASGLSGDSEAKYSFSSVKESDGRIHHTCSVEIRTFGASPPSGYKVGESEVNVPGFQKLKCTSVSGNTETKVNDKYIWVIALEGESWEDADEGGGNEEKNTKYTYSVKKEGGKERITGTKEVLKDDADLVIGDFKIGGKDFVGTGVSGSNEWIEDDKERWTVTYEGEVEDEGEEDEHEEYTYSVKKEGDKTYVTGTKEVYSDVADFTPKDFSIDDMSFTCTNVSGNSETLEDGTKRWTVTYEGTSDESSSTTGKITYTVEKYKSEAGFDFEKGTKTVEVKTPIPSGGEGSTPFTPSAPTFTHQVGSTGDMGIPGITCIDFKCIRNNASGDEDGEGNWVWTITYEGAGVTVPNGYEVKDTQSESYELNGITTRDVNGGFVVLRRSETPITKKTITMYTADDSSDNMPGDTLDGGIVISHRKAKEEIRENGVLLVEYYRHDIEVEG